MRNETILIVTDSDSRDIYPYLSVGNKELAYVQSSESLNFMRNYKADIVLLDCGHDPAQGLGLLTEMKQCSQSTPVIFITDVTSYDTVLKAYKLGVRDFHKKPVSKAELTGVVMNLLLAKRKSIESRVPELCVKSTGNCRIPVGITPEVPEYIADVVDFIVQNPSRINRLSDLSGRVNLSKYHFSRMFKELTGFSPMEFVRIIRMHKAKKFLRRTDLPVSAVAEEVGFRDFRNFERRFKQYTGYTPPSYRKSLHKI